MADRYFYVDLDTAEPDNVAFLAYLHRAGIAMEILEEHGPAGGNPLVRYITTSHAALVALIRTQFTTGDEASDSEMVGLIEEAKL